MVVASEQTTMPEPPDGYAVLWRARDLGEEPVVILRDDRLAESWHAPADRWHTPNTPGPSTTWAEACRIADANDCPMSEAVVLAPTPEVVDGHPREPGGYCRRCGEPHSEPEWQRLADRAREGGGS